MTNFKKRNKGGDITIRLGWYSLASVVFFPHTGTCDTVSCPLKTVKSSHHILALGNGGNGV